MKPFQVLLFSFVYFQFMNQSVAQIATSFYYDGWTASASGTYFEKHPSSNEYYVGTMRNKDSYNFPISVISKLDENCNTIWHSEISHPEFFSSISGVNDIKVNENNIFISTYLFTSNPNQRIRIYKMDLNGVVIDSVEFAHPAGIKRAKSEMDFDGDGNLISAFRSVNDSIHFIKVDPATMTILTNQTIGNTNASINVIRDLTVEYDGANAVVAYNKTDTIAFTKLDGGASVIDNFYVINPNGQIADFVVNQNNYVMLINEDNSPSTPADNPIRIIEVTNTGTLISDDTYSVQKMSLFTNMAIDQDDNIYVSGQAGSPGDIGVIAKISSSLVYEFIPQQTTLSEIEVHGNDIVTTGFERDAVNDCQEDNRGTSIILYDRNSIPDFETVSPHVKLSFNNLNATISYNSTNFTNPVIGAPGFEINGTGGHTIYWSSLLLAGKDDQGNVYSANQIFTNLFASGPITNSSAYNQIERDKWDRVWKVTKSQIDAHIIAFQVGDASYTIPEVILKWPALGDPSKGQSQYLAKFKDVNNNGTYEPEEGEYPLIKGDYCVLSIYNNVNSDADENCMLLADRLKIQVYEYVYGFDCPQDSSLQNTLFVYYELINRSGENIYDTYIGNQVDFDIIQYYDDFIASDPLRSICYGYTGIPNSDPYQAYMILASEQDKDSLDNSFGIGAQESPNGFGYGDGIIDNERRGMTNFMFYNNSSGVTGDPVTPTDYYGYLSSVWKDGSHQTYSGTDYTSSAIESNFFFPDNTDTLFYSTNGINPGAAWSEENEGNLLGDRRGIGSSGPFTFYSNDTLKFDVAFVTGMESVSGGYTSKEAMLGNVDSVRNYFTINETPCSQNFDFYEPFDGPYTTIGISKERESSDILVYPNPSTGHFNIKGLPANSNIAIININGQTIQNFQPTSSECLLNLSGLPDGIYFICVTSSNTIKYVKIVKQ